MVVSSKPRKRKQLKADGNDLTATTHKHQNLGGKQQASYDRKRQNFHAYRPQFKRPRDPRQGEDEEEARVRELVFGKGESSLLESFGAEDAGRGDGEVSQPAPARSGRGGGPESSLQPQSEGHDEPLWVEDLKGDASVLVGDGGGVREEPRPEQDRGGGGGKDEQVADGPAWVDEDDARVEVDISAKKRLRKLRENWREGSIDGGEFEQRLRTRFTKSNITTDWAKSAEEDAVKLSRRGKALVERRSSRDAGGDSSDEEGGEDEEVDADIEDLLKDSRPLGGGNGGVLQPGHLNIVRCKDANQQEPAKAVVRAVSFHPSGELLLTGGFDKSLRLFQVDGVRNNKMHSIFFEDMPISNAVFTANDQAIVSGRRSYFYWYDVPTGKVRKVPRIHSSGREEKHLERFAASPDGRWLAFVGSGGYVLLLSNQTKQWAADFKLNSVAKAITFTPDSAYILASGADGDIYQFDIRSRRCVKRFFNEGGTCTTSLAMSSSATHPLTAVGSDSGVVNVYDAGALGDRRGFFRPSPLKALMSLTTPVTIAKFNPDGQILAIASDEKRDALKVIHTASCSPFTNWPTERTPTRYPYALDFSPGGGFLAVGNDRGCVLLYRLRHYPQA